MQTFPLLDYKNYELDKHILPILAKFENNQKQLWFFAALHLYDFENPMFKSLEESFYDLKPDLVVLEGSTKINPQHPKKTEYYSKILKF
jgi:hypothetical protein